MKKIDIFNHIWPMPFYEALIGHIGTMTDITMRSGAVPMMTNLDRRFEVMDMFGPDYMQVLSLASPPLELLAGPSKAMELSKIGSDSMAELCQKYPDRFPGFIGTAPGIGAIMMPPVSVCHQASTIGARPSPTTS